MEKPFTAMEMTSNSLKLIVGYELDGRAIVLDTLAMPLAEAVINGQLTNPQVAAQATLKLVDQVKNDLGFQVTDAVIAVPPIGLEVYVVDKTTNIVSPMGKIEKIDIQNVISLVRNEPVGTDKEIVGIVADLFLLDQGRAFSNPPIGDTSSTLTLHAKIHVLPKNIVDGYRKAVTLAGLKIRRIVVAPYAAAEVVKGYKEMPEDYILFDYGARFSTVSFIGGHQLYSTNFIHKGSDFLTEALASGLKISFNEANKLKEVYGIDHRQLSYKGIISSIVDENGKTVDYTIDSINEILEKALAEYADDVNRCLNELLANYDDTFRTLPVVVIGGGARLNGLFPVLDQYLAPHQVLSFTPKAMGGRTGAFTTVLGLIKIANKFKTSFEEEKRPIATVTREETSDKKKKSFSATEDEL